MQNQPQVSVPNPFHSEPSNVTASTSTSPPLVSTAT
jgi:hypothetical protein